MKVQLKTVEFWQDVRGPGPRNQSDATATHTTHKVKSGEKEATETGLTIIWDQEAQAVYLVKAGAKEDPVVCCPWTDVRRAIPKDGMGWLEEHMTAPAPHKGGK